jgi:hypothetical protein
LDKQERNEMNEDEVIGLIQLIKSIQKQKIDCDVGLRNIALIVSSGYFQDSADIEVLINSQKILKRKIDECQIQLRNFVEEFGDDG